MIINSYKINLLKALAILVVVSGHLEFSIIPLFPPYSFQVMLFFFIAGILYNPEYSFGEYLIRRIKSLIVPYFLYAFFYLIMTIAITPVIGKFWGMEINFKNEFLYPFLTGHQLDLISPLWFVPCLFITLLIYKLFSYIKVNQNLKLLFYLLLALLAIKFQAMGKNIAFLWIFRSMFALLFVHLGYLYKTKIEGRINIFSEKIFYFVIIAQSILWLTNKDYSPMQGIGLHFLLVWSEYNNPIVPILSSITGIWISLFIVRILSEKIKNWTFIEKIGKNSYHIMANHLLVFNFITYSILFFKGIPFDIKNSSDIYWFYNPIKTTYFYFTVGIVVTTYFGEFLKKLKKYFFLK